ncbi:MAG: TetR/AcrR family transcriptional regulator [Paracoccaceae bacterium]
MVKKSGRPPRSEKDIHAMRSKIARVAQNLFRAEGFDAVSIRRLAKEVGCAPMTIYAHFDTKTDILRYMWSDVFDVLFDEIDHELKDLIIPETRLKVAAQTFVEYWLLHLDEFRLIFMSNDVSRGDVDTFLKDGATRKRFQFFAELVEKSSASGANTKTKTDLLIASMIGIALCHITIRNYPWSAVPILTNTLVSDLLKS